MKVKFIAVYLIHSPVALYAHPDPLMKRGIHVYIVSKSGNYNAHFLRDV